MNKPIDLDKLLCDLSFLREVCSPLPHLVDKGLTSLVNVLKSGSLDYDEGVSVDWFKTKKPLQDGWYWWRCSQRDPEPEVLQVCNEYIIDNLPTDSHGHTNEIYEHQNFSGEWCGPIYPPSGTPVVEIINILWESYRNPRTEGIEQ